MVLRRRAELGTEEQQRSDGEQRSFEADHRGQRVAGLGARRSGQRNGEQRQAAPSERQAGPLTAPDAKAEDAVRRDGDEHHTRRENDLYDRHRGERQRPHVQQPGSDGDEHPNREPARAEQGTRALQRMAYGVPPL